MKKKLLIVLSLGIILISLTGCLSMLFPEPNNPPAITSAPVETATVGEEYVYNVLATDPDGDDLTYSLTTNPPDMVINENTGIINWTPTATGTYDVVVEISDGKLNDIQSFNITVSEPPNQAPTITTIPDAAITLGETYSYTVEAADPDGDDLTYSLIDKPTDMVINPTTGLITWTPTAVGIVEVTVEVSDGKLNDIQSFNITVSEPPNQTPTITTIPDAAITLGETYSYTVEAADPDGDTLTYSLTTNPSTDMTIDENSGVISWTPTAVGIVEATVEVSDGELSDIRSFTITVSPVPVGPTIVSLSPLEAVVGELYTGQVTATPGSNATLAYSLIGAPEGMTINSITGLITWIPAAAGDKTVTVIVTNGIGLSDSKDFTIVVSSVNQSPIITSIPDAAITLGETFSYTVEAADPDGDDLTYSLTTNPSTDMTIDENSGVISWTPTAVGIVEATVEVSDGELTDTESFTIVVNPSLKRVVMFELFGGAACSRCEKVHPDIVRLRQEYGLDKLVILEEYVSNSDYTGWAIPDVQNRYYDYFRQVGSEYRGYPAAFFNGINQFVYYGDKGYTDYKAAIEAELAKPTKIAISASYSVTGKIVNISGNIVNISSSTLNNLVVEAMVYENSVYSEYRGYNVDHVVRDIITYEESGETISSFAPGESFEFSLTSSYLSNVHNMNNIHVVVYVQAPNTPTKEILQALYVE